MSALAMPAQEVECCPAWCEQEAHYADLHQLTVELPRDEDGRLLMNLSEDFGEEPTIGLVNWDDDSEIYMTPDEAEKVGTILLQLAAAARSAARLAA